MCPASTDAPHADHFARACLNQTGSALELPFHLLQSRQPFQSLKLALALAMLGAVALSPVIPVT